jgi:hypothetical protein
VRVLLFDEIIQRIQGVEFRLAQFEGVKRPLAGQAMERVYDAPL